ncbi:MAG TPA: DUF4149 domain-containing protein [Gemmatimonadaceae bacterium]|nr:DUF4149 domain-containing protein [Gemmatimonadaceae bacterium]
MRSWYLANVTLHVLAALIWLGGMFFLGLVGAPVLRGVEPASLRQKLFHDLGLRFRAIGWICIAILLATGVVNLAFRGWLRWDGVFGSADFWRSAAGTALGIKLGAVAVMLALSAIHDFRLGPEAGRVAAGSPEALALRRRAARLARFNAIVGLVLLIAAVRLARGG